MPSVADILFPGGKPLGSKGKGRNCREVSGGMKKAQEMFDELTMGALDVTPLGYPGKMMRLPGGGTVGLRPTSKTGPPTIDVKDVPQVPVRKVKVKFL